jgi:hypothetical protein
MSWAGVCSAEDPRRFRGEGKQSVFSVGKGGEEVKGKKPEIVQQPVGQKESVKQFVSPFFLVSIREKWLSGSR